MVCLDDHCAGSLGIHLLSKIPPWKCPKTHITFPKSYILATCIKTPPVHTLLFTHLLIPTVSRRTLVKLCLRRWFLPLMSSFLRNCLKCVRSLCSINLSESYVWVYHVTQYLSAVILFPCAGAETDPAICCSLPTPSSQVSLKHWGGSNRLPQSSACIFSIIYSGYVVGMGGHRVVKKRAHQKACIGRRNEVRTSGNAQWHYLHFHEFWCCKLQDSHVTLNSIGRLLRFE